MALVLVVDDEPTQLLDLRNGLQARAHTVVLAPDGRTALERLGELVPDLVVLDLLLPVVDGWEVLAELERREASPPVLALAAGREKEQAVVSALRQGAVACLAKPVELPDLLDLVDELLALDDDGRARYRSERLEELDEA